MNVCVHLRCWMGGELPLQALGWQVSLGRLPERSCLVCRLGMPRGRSVPRASPRSPPCTKSAPLPPCCWFWQGVALCVPQAAAEGRQRLLARLLLDISQNGWREEQNAGGLVHETGGVPNGVDSYPRSLVSVAKVGCLTKRGDSTAAFKALTTKQGIKPRQP